jgi:hypothetical protein
LDGLAAEIGRDAITVVVEGKGSGLGDFALGAVEESLTQLQGIDGTGSRSGVLAEALEGRLAGLGVELGMVDDLKPGQEGLIEEREGRDGGRGEFGKQVGLDKLEEALDLATAFGIVRGTEDALDAQGSADSVELVGLVDATPIDVDGKGATIAQDSTLEAIFHTGELLIPIELSVRDQTRMIIKKGEKKDLALAVGISGIGEIGAVHRVGLPQVAKVRTFEAAIGFGTLLGQELGSGGTAAGELAAQSARSNARFGDGVGGVEREDADDGAGRTEGLLTFEGLGPVEGLG